MNRLRKIERVAAYIRVSTQEQKLHGISLDAQKMKLIAYAKKHNLKIVEWYMDEGVSGRKLIKNRPELQRMIQDAEKGEFDRIIFIKLDRFFRSIAEYHEAMKRIAPVIWTATEEEYDLSTANGRMLVNMKITIAEMEADQGGERIKVVNEYKTSTGQPLTGNLPFGFMITTDEQTQRKKIVKEPEEAPILTDAIEHFLTHQSKRKTIIYLHAKYHVSLSYRSLSDLLVNPMLYGGYRDNPTYCESYIDKETFDRIQVILKRNIKERRASNRGYLFTGLLRCPDCGRALNSGYVIKKKNGKQYIYNRYRCYNRSNNRACDFSKTVFESTIEKLLLENLEQYLNDAKIGSVEITDGDFVPKYNITDIHAQIDRLNYSWQTGKILTVESYEKQHADLMEQLKLALEEQTKQTPKDFTKIEGILHAGWKEIYNALDAEHKRSFWRSFISAIEIDWETERKKISKVKFF